MLYCMYLYYNVVLYVLVFLFHFPHLNTSKPSIEGYMLWFHFVDPNCVNKYLREAVNCEKKDFL